MTPFQLVFPTHSLSLSILNIPMTMMLSIEEVLCELSGEDMTDQGLPPGFRFHPTDEELITFYLASKVFHGSFCGIHIAEVDLNRCEPWELPEMAKMGEREWYFFSLRDRKYPTGLRTNRATGAGYWKATGKDREVYSASSGALLGMKKTLVFYKGRAPRGEKTKWVMHEYRLDGDFSYRHTCKEEWVICRIFHKTGDKKNGLLQGQGYGLMEPCRSPISTSLPPMLEAPATLECQSLDNPFQENDLKSFINPLVSQSHAGSVNAFHPSFSPITTTSAINNNTCRAITSNNMSTSMLFKSLLSHQECDFKEQSPVPKQCKTEGNFSHFQLHADANCFNLSWVDKFHLNPYQNPMFFEMDCNVSGFSDGTAAHDTSISTAFNRADFQMVLDPPI